jgi:hypothetical protein
LNRAQVVFAATVVLAVVFSIEGTLRLARIDFHVLRFAVWGYPPWAVWAVSLGQILGAGLLLWPRTFAAGAWLLAAISAGFVATHVASGDGTVVFAPLAMLAGLGGLAAMRRVQEG